MVYSQFVFLSNLFRDAGENSGMFGSKLGEDFTVELEAIFLQFCNKRTIGLVATVADGGV